MSGVGTYSGSKLEFLVSEKTREQYVNFVENVNSYGDRPYEQGGKFAGKLRSDELAAVNNKDASKTLAQEAIAALNPDLQITQTETINKGLNAAVEAGKGFVKG